MQFYVYVLSRPDGRPFYVGKGSGDRVFKHDTEARSGCQCHKCRVIRKIWRNGGELQRYVVFTTNDEQEAFDYERQVIELYGQHTLTNATAGGRGGFRPSPKTRAKLRRGKKKLAQTPKIKTILAEGRARRWASPDARAKASARQIGRVVAPETRAKISAALVGRPLPPDHRARLPPSPEVQARLSAASKAYFSEHGHPMKGKHFPPEFGARIAEIRRDRDWWKDKQHSEETKRKMSAAKQGRVFSEQHRRAIAEARKTPCPALRHRDTNEVIPAGVDLKAFCRERGLTYSCMRIVIRGERQHHLGWMVLPPD